MPSRFYQKVIALSKKPEDFKRPVSTTQLIETQCPPSPSTVEDRPTSTVEELTTSTVEAVRSLWEAEGAEGVFTSSRVRRVLNAQDALTHVEEAVYDILWGPKRKGEQEEYRLTRMGYAELSSKSRVS